MGWQERGECNLFNASCPVWCCSVLFQSIICANASQVPHVPFFIAPYHLCPHTNAYLSDPLHAPLHLQVPESSPLSLQILQLDHRMRGNTLPLPRAAFKYALFCHPTGPSLHTLHWVADHTATFKLVLVGQNLPCPAQHSALLNSHFTAYHQIHHCILVARCASGWP